MEEKEAIESDISNVDVGEKIPLEEFRKLIKADKDHLTDEEVLVIRDFVYTMATIEYLYFTQEYLVQKREKPKQNAEESISIHQGQYRRAS
jgi:hypothetical protein